MILLFHINYIHLKINKNISHFHIFCYFYWFPLSEPIMIITKEKKYITQTRER